MGRLMYMSHSLSSLKGVIEGIIYESVLGIFKWGY